MWGEQGEERWKGVVKQNQFPSQLLCNIGLGRAHTAPRGLCPPAAELHLIRKQDTPPERLRSLAKMMQGPHTFPAVCTTKSLPPPPREDIPTNSLPTVGVRHRMGTKHTDDLSRSIVCLFLALLVFNFSIFFYTLVTLIKQPLFSLKMLKDKRKLPSAHRDLCKAADDKPAKPLSSRHLGRHSWTDECKTMGRQTLIHGDMPRGLLGSNLCYLLLFCLSNKP